MEEAYSPINSLAMTTSDSSNATASITVLALQHKILKRPELLGLDISSIMKYKIPP
jgi:hypothetical protein